MAPRVFISHAQQDRDLVDDLSVRLKHISSDITLVAPDLKPGQDWSAALLSELKKADEILILLTPNSLHSSHVWLEVGAATGLGKNVVPIVVGLEDATLPSWVRNIHFVKYAELNDYLPDLVKRVDKGAVPAQDAPVKAGVV